MIIFSLILAFLGFFDAAYLTILHYKHIIPPCTLAKTCDIVLTSKYATVFGIPTALYGAVYYLVLIVLLGILTHNKKDLKINNLLSLKSVIFILSFCGLLISGALVYIQGFVLYAFCQYCLISEAINLVLFILIWKIKQEKKLL